MFSNEYFYVEKSGFEGHRIMAVLKRVEAR